MFPTINQRAENSISSISLNKTRAIRCYAKLCHPDQSDTRRYILNNAMGNVLA
ncbi:unnamed protein product, partial [Rotaria magnacalcarata]